MTPEERYYMCKDCKYHGECTKNAPNIDDWRCYYNYPKSEQLKFDKLKEEELESIPEGEYYE